MTRRNSKLNDNLVKNDTSEVNENIVDIMTM